MELEDLTGIDDVEVELEEGVYTITFVAPASTDQPELVVVESTLMRTVSMAV